MCVCVCVCVDPTAMYIACCVSPLVLGSVPLSPALSYAIPHPFILLVCCHMGLAEVHLTKAHPWCNTACIVMHLLRPSGALYGILNAQLCVCTVCS